MAHVIYFRTSKFDVTTETPNPNNPIAGESVLTWLRESLADSGYNVSEPDADDWGWYMDLRADGQSYLIGASGDPDTSAKDVDWVVQLHKNRSLMDKMFGRNRLDRNDSVSRSLQGLIDNEPLIRDVVVEI